MKNILKHLLIFTLLFSFTNCKAQEGRIEPLSSYGDSPSGSYYKDMNNNMINYTGIWKGIYNKNHIFLKIEKLTKNKHISGDGSYYYIDELIGRYIIYSGDPDLPSTTIIASSLNQSNEVTPLISIGDGRNNQFKFAYSDTQFCGAEGELILRRNLNNPNELTYLFSPKGYFVFDPDCPYNGTIPVPLPHAIITLTRVN